MSNARLETPIRESLEVACIGRLIIYWSSQSYFDEPGMNNYPYMPLQETEMQS